MKIAPIMASFSRHPALVPILVHTGQHYDDAMKTSFFGQLGIPEPDVDLEVGSASHALQTAEIMKRFEPVLLERQPDAVLVVGDVNSTIACALVASKLDVPVCHVEAGLRSFDRRLPEEINRVLTDQLSSLLFTTERAAEDNLRREGIDSGRIRFVGNVMIDTLVAQSKRAPDVFSVLERYEVGRALSATDSGYAVVTLHRPSNVDDVKTLRSLIECLGEVAERLPVVFPVHPRTQARLRETSLIEEVSSRVILIPAVGYLEMIGLMKTASMVLTDSGGVQEETTALGIPCLTLRENTERPITVEQGTNTVVGTSKERILAAVDQTLRAGEKRGRLPELWDGHAAERIAQHTADWLGR